MENLFFEKPILNSPYEYPSRHWELDAQGQPTQKIIEKRRRAEFITPIPKKNSGQRSKAIFPAPSKTQVRPNRRESNQSFGRRSDEGA
jgi:hypothetical protein